MNCINKKEWIIYQESGFDAERRAEIDRHLQECSRCQKMAKEFEQVFDALDGLKVPVPSPHFTEKVARSIHHLRQETGWERVVLPAVATAAAVLSLGLGFFLGRSLFDAMQNGESTEITSQTAYQGIGEVPVDFNGNGDI